MTKNIVVFGAPGAGKGTLCGKINAFNPIVHVSTGDLFRENVGKQTPIGKKAKSYMDAGKLVPDEIVIAMVKDRIAKDDVCDNGLLMDGFPRTLAQAQILDDLVQLDKVLVLDIEHDTLKERILGRYSCPQCNRIYNIYNDDLKPQQEGLCDDCGVELTHREDDNEETFEKRWQTYIDQSQEVIEYYESREGLVVHLDGSHTMDITEDTIKEVTGLE
jgi:adenylate kinase